MTQAHQIEGLLSYYDVAKLVNRSQRTLHRWYTHHKMPPPVRVGQRVVGWRASVIAEWLDNSTMLDNDY
jgi:predicted DNA-binding transcriptional regulator AlpA